MRSVPARGGGIGNVIGKGGARCAAPRVSGELGVQDAQTPALQVQAPLDLAQFALQVDLFPVLEHRALLLAEPFLLDARPLGDRGEEVLVLMREACPQRLQVRMGLDRAARRGSPGRA